MKKDKNRIVIFSHSTKYLEKTLKSTVNLANMINGEIVLFLVKKPSDVVREESQLSAIRALSHEYIATDKKIRDILNGYSKTFGVPISYSCSVGNIKNETKKYIQDNSPDVVVLEKRKSAMLDFLGNNTIDYVLQHHQGPIFIVSNDITLEQKNLSMAFLKTDGRIKPVPFAENLLMYTQKPIKSFTITKNCDGLGSYNEFNGKKTIDFVFEKRDDSFKNLSNYLTINNINLLCVNRTNDNFNKKNKHSPDMLNVKDIIANLNVPMLFTGEHNYTS
ncbi:universal stress protein [Maribacter sp. MMG018]|uniref:universal stress protein n=1 Tax=Maribacter sp. MMG018 TaxID=2822688 RepID=UPI001B38427B|nr:universal stress protein [Maribacter sp. MMG018]MBQ4913207.1 universal stress protein [Maribacter sp. MMG018]